MFSFPLPEYYHTSHPTFNNDKSTIYYEDLLFLCYCSRSEPNKYMTTFFLNPDDTFFFHLLINYFYIAITAVPLPGDSQGSILSEEQIAKEETSLHAVPEYERSLSESGTLVEEHSLSEEKDLSDSERKLCAEYIDVMEAYYEMSKKDLNKIIEGEYVNLSKYKNFKDCEIEKIRNLPMLEHRSARMQVEEEASGNGAYGTVYQLCNNEGKVLKVYDGNGHDESFKYRLMMAYEEAVMFRKYYGDDAAKIYILDDGEINLEMGVIPGEPVYKVDVFKKTQRNHFEKCLTHWITRVFGSMICTLEMSCTTTRPIHSIPLILVI